MNGTYAYRNIMTGQLSEEALLRALRGALRQLYNPTALRRNPLNEFFGIRDRSGGLHEVLLDAVRALNPVRGASVHSDARRTYQILSHRYVEQFSQNEVAMSLGLSVRQLRRQEQLAIRTLGEYLRMRYEFEIAANVAGANTSDANISDANRALVEEKEEETQFDPDEQYQEDLAWLHHATPHEFLDVGEMIAGALQTSEPIFRELGLSVQTRLSPDLPRIAVNAIALRQALVITLTAVARLAADKELYIAVIVGKGEVCIEIQLAGQTTRMLPEVSEKLAMAQRLLTLSDGSLSVQNRAERIEHSKLQVILTLPLVQPLTVLIIDDNQDALQLLQRFLTGTRYHPVMTRNPSEGLVMTQQLAPQAVLLDVMLPGMDGWELLARLRRHPATQHIPVIICTILPEEQLARALGASGFLRKPLARGEVLETLQRINSPA